MSIATLVGVAPTTAVAEGDSSSGTSSRSGLEYSGTYNCIRQRPNLYRAPSERIVEVQVEVIQPGRTPSFTRRDVAPSQFGEGGLLSLAGEGVAYPPDSVFVVRDRLPGDSAWTEVIRVGPSQCQDYDADTEGTYVPVDPTRVLDTRPDSRTNHAAGRPTAGQTLTIPASVMPDRPDDVLAVALTLTMAGPDGRGFAQAFPTGAVTPGSTSNVNADGSTTAYPNLVVSTVGSDGSVSLFTSVGTHLIADIVGYFVASDSGTATAGRLERITPQRLFDSRPGERINSDGTRLARGETRRIDLTADDSGLPPGALAAIVNVTSVDPASRGFIQAAAGGALVPGASSVLNLGPGEVRAGLTIVPLAPDGTIDVFSEAGAHVIVDLAGWFTGPDAEESGTGLYVPLVPERLLDTRPTLVTGVHNSSTFEPGVPPGSDLSRLARYGDSSSDDISTRVFSDRASAAFVNLTAINPTAPGFLSFSFDRSTSAVNFRAGNVVANAAIIDGGERPFWSPARAFLQKVDLAVDVTGYFTS